MMRYRTLIGLVAAVAFAAGLAPCPALAQTTIIVGSKKFTESVILGEIAKQTAESLVISADHRAELGGTRILFDALAQGQIDVYPEYTGTILKEILAAKNLQNEAQMRHTLAELGIGVTGALGFNNTYAIGVTPKGAERLGINTISDLAAHTDLRFGFTNEFMDREDGWPALRRTYALPQADVTGLDHDVALRALQDGSIDATDLYSTDAEIAFYGFKVLADDKAFFPRYDALFLYRLQLEKTAPAFVTMLKSLAGSIDEARMISMNKRVKIDRETEAAVAAEFCQQKFGVTAVYEEETLGEKRLRWLRQHLHMVLVSMVLAVALAIPLGVVAGKFTRAGQIILGATGIIQTIPALAMLALLMRLPWPRPGDRPDMLGIGAETAIAALFLYSLLPIVRNTQSGLAGIDLVTRESAAALGLSSWARLIKIELPLASRTILAGIKTAIVINIGFATLGALIGAGGYGQPILTGIRLNNKDMILEGTIPAALLALLAQGLFELAERTLVPRGLRLKSHG